MMKNKLNLTQKPIVITPGEPAGIGPELCIQLVQTALDIPLVFMADRSLLADRAREIACELEIIEWDGQTFSGSSANTIVIQHTPLNETCKSGELNTANAQYVLNCLDKAIDGCLDGTFLL